MQSDVADIIQCQMTNKWGWTTAAQHKFHILLQMEWFDLCLDLFLDVGTNLHR
jgi:hypothetical protein